MKKATLALVIVLALYVVSWSVLGCERRGIIGDSMKPTLHDGDIILETLTPWERIERGDIVAIKSKLGKEGRIIKRVIGLPGEDIEIRENGSVWINGRHLPEPYVSPEPYLANRARTHLAANCYFVIGDNRAHSGDSREFGPIYKNSIAGKAKFFLWPREKAFSSLYAHDQK